MSATPGDGSAPDDRAPPAPDTTTAPDTATPPDSARRGILTRRRVLGAGLAGLGALLAARFGLPRYWRPGPSRPLGAEAAAFVARCFADVDRASLWDTHAHIVGVGAGGSGCTLNPEFLSHAHPFKRLQFELYLGAAGIDDMADGDAQYLERLLALHRAANPAGKLVALAFDRFVDEAGVEHPEHSNFFTPNDYVLDLAARHPELRACASVHPYRTDAVARLDAAAERGAVAVKWLPNAMGIDPASPRCDAFYRRLAELDLPLITHAGKEQAVDAAELQELGNPLRVRRALEHGVRVVLAHCGTLGDSLDLDAVDDTERRVMENVDLFLRLMGESQWEGRLFGEISALTFINRTGRPLREILGATELHPRLVNGSDWPLPGVDPVISTRLLHWRGYLTDEDRRLCEEVYTHNPLLFDYVVKRRVKVDGPGGPVRFPPTVFETAHLFV